ncbi:VOC family protein [Cellulomonas edaphi]|uniref:VOC family protein n=1 Tax=Cellulomonas edaphi TaxID=3053468 RepID=A0ABT7S2X2_9CELL|nr:VOC family protein [Cellulomons edaphi]MDM7829961.1 VOC family protein [Cellulomons edaphi]
MIGRLDEVVVDCRDPLALAGFWAQVLGGTPELRDPDWCRLQAPGSPLIAFQRVPEAKTTKNRLHLDVLVDDVEAATLEAEALGATRQGGVHRDTAGSFQVLTDPEGNEWCVVSPA